MHMRAWTSALAATLLAPACNAAGLGNLDLNSVDSIKNVAATVAFDTMSYYNENKTGQIPGKLPDTWWEGGFLFNMLIQYWFYTGDTSYNPTTTQGLLWQKGANNDYMPQNWTNYLGNDDQVFWGLAAMTAAEVNYPEEAGQPSWLSLAQAVFNTQAPRWDTELCGGGLRWQLFPYQGGYKLKNSVSNGGFFQLAARLARYTGNQTYADWAIKTWDWCARVPLLDETTWNVADSVTNKDNCTSQGNLQWTYNYGCFFTGAAYMYAFTNDQLWSKRVNGLLGKLFENFFPEKYGGNILAEPACDEPFNCNRDQNCFKGLVASWLGVVTYLVPSTAAQIMPKLQASAQAAAKACVGGSNGRQCGLRWWQPSWDGSYGIEQQASVLSLMSVNLIGKTGGAPKTASTGGTSKSDPGAGSAATTGPKTFSPINTSDRAGAGVLTALVVSALVAGSVWLVWP